MKKIFSYPKSLKPAETHYCAGCGHGIIHRIIAEVIDEMGLRENTVAVAPVGCAVVAYDYFNFDMTESAHGRAPAVATGIRRTLPDRLVFTYQGDGDLAAIGTAEIIHAANRGEKISVIFVNNAVYGMTNGQMAPTTLLSQKTETTPLGRDAERDGYPLKITEMLASLPGVKFLARKSTHSPQEIAKAKQAIRDAFKIQRAGLGFSMVEILSACPTCWGLSPKESLDWIKNRMVPYYPLGRIKEPESELAET
ncbi:MAG: thiamine pyrophosphate-dependent enzyme [Candidatus Omnitrophica bacterium]|nr:thiamine pyrophosphate-dependent enzyme [Candidatus Omnitrophota bacterium]